MFLKRGKSVKKTMWGELNEGKGRGRRERKDLSQQMYFNPSFSRSYGNPGYLVAERVDGNSGMKKGLLSAPRKKTQAHHEKGEKREDRREDTQR